jgi:drug/metabolite transporter (DMT)-like permease
MTPELMSAAAAFCYGLSDVCVKKGLRDTSTTSGLLLSLVAGLVTVGVALFQEELFTFSGRTLLLFSLAGLVGPGLGRVISIRAVHYLGPALAAPIQSTTYPLFGFLGGIVFLGEAITAGKLFGATAITTGIYALTVNHAQSSTPVGLAEGPLKTRGSSARALGIPLAAGLCYGVADLIRKEGIELGGKATVGAFAGLACALVLWSSAATFLMPVKRGLRVGPSAPWFAISGSCTGLASLLVFKALEQGGDVSIISPIVAASPLVVFFLSALLLRDVERIHFGLIVSGMVVVLGGVVMSL